MARDERVAAVAGKLSRLKARHNDLGEEISELEDELAQLKRTREKPAKNDPSPRRRSSGHADEHDDDNDNEDDDAGDGDQDDDDDDDADDEKPRVRRERR